MRRLLALIALFALAAPLSLAAAQPTSAATAPAPDPDYAVPSSWLCRPGSETACTADLDAIAVGPDGTRTPQPFVTAADPAIDCFYVYPTISRETAPYADMTASRQSIDDAAWQFYSLDHVCRVQLLTEATRTDPVPVDPEHARVTNATVGTAYIGWLHFQTCFAEISKQEPDLFD